jgi:hypothetical protein
MESNNSSKNNEFHPLYAEEIFIVHLYGNDDEIARFEKLLENKESPDVQVEMIILCEEITRRVLTKMNKKCCSGCSYANGCIINHRRSSRNMATYCCSYCPKYRECLRDHQNSCRFDKD